MWKYFIKNKFENLGVETMNLFVKSKTAMLGSCTCGSKCPRQYQIKIVIISL